MNGIVKFYNFKKRFGFITDDDGKDYFFHQTGIIGESQNEIRDNVKVDFEVADDDKGPKAINIKVI
jgi:CspA family cold shock protein